jgi:predicted transcriptional regulator
VKSEGLLSALTFSEKRKEILFLLEESPKTLSEIKTYFNLTSTEVLHRLREMENVNMILKQEELYQLSSMGKIAALHYKPFLDTLASIEANEDFWRNHDLEKIPETLLCRIKELKDCRIIKDENEYIYTSHQSFIENVMSSTHFAGLASIFLPNFPQMFLGLARKNIPVSIIVTSKVFLQVKREYMAEFGEFIKYGHTNFYVTDDSNISFGVTDHFFSLSLCFKNGTYDPGTDLVGFDPDSIKWGEGLFAYYKENSIEIL